MDQQSVQTRQNFLSISPMIRETLERRRAEELRDGRPVTMSLLERGLIDPRMIGSMQLPPGGVQRQMKMSQQIYPDLKQSNLLPSFAGNDSGAPRLQTMSGNQFTNQNSITMEFVQS